MGSLAGWVRRPCGTAAGPSDPSVSDHLRKLADAALAIAPALPTETPPDRRRKFTIIQDGKE
jgi:hypothetical protein